jgi:DNA-binding NtrC family response regulator
VNAGRFRADLYFRLAVVRTTMPALRQRPEDLPMLAEALLRRLDADEEQLALVHTPGFAERLREHTWPGNVRELRNYLERCLVFQDVLPTSDILAEPAVPVVAPTPLPADLLAMPLTTARELAVEAFEREYLTRLLQAHGGKMNQAAAAAGVGRVYLYKLLVKHRLKKRRAGEGPAR